MTAFLLIPGAGGSASFWCLVVERLRDRGDVAIALDLPADDADAGLSAYVELAVAGGEGYDDLVVVAQSMGAFTAVPACERLAPRRLVLLNATIPAPGERAADWDEHTGADDSRRAAAQAGGYPDGLDLQTCFLHDVPPEAAARGLARPREEAEIAFVEPCPFSRWPDVPTRVLAGRDDRLLPFGFQRRVARERLLEEVVPVPGGHLAALSEPDAVTSALVAEAASRRPTALRARR
jgi:pimeloyl-ACP methyl ester carboxylesterase